MHDSVDIDITEIGEIGYPGLVHKAEYTEIN